MIHRDGSRQSSVVLHGEESVRAQFGKNLESLRKGGDLKKLNNYCAGFDVVQKQR